MDPVSGRQFRSMQEVFRYLKSEDSGGVESKSDDKGRTSMEIVNRSQSVSENAIYFFSLIFALSLFFLYVVEHFKLMSYHKQSIDQMDGQCIEP